MRFLASLVLFASPFALDILAESPLGEVKNALSVGWRFVVLVFLAAGGVLGDTLDLDFIVMAGRSLA